MKKGPYKWHYATAWPTNSLRLDPENRLCSQWDATGIRKFQLAYWGNMGFQVLDDFCMEHMM